MTYSISGATGHLGRQIIAQLSRLVPATQITLGVHTLSKAKAFAAAGMGIVPIDYQEPTSLQNLLLDCDVFIYIPSKSQTSFQRVEEFENVLQAVEKSNIKHLIVMGFIADQVNNPFALSAFYGYAPRRLAQTDIPYTVLRNALYADPLVPYLPELVQRQHVIYPMADKALTFIGQKDSAAAFAKVATTPALQQNGRIYTLTQTRHYTMPELAAVLSQVSGRPIDYQPVTLTEFAQLHNQNGEGKMLASMYAGGARGLLQEVSGDYQTIMGHPAQSLPEFMQAAVANESF